jgi:predicted PurR-regulated permease PerM
MRLRPYVVQYDIDLVRLAQNTLQTVSATIVEQVTDVARSVPRLLLNLTIIIMTFFVFIRDGARIIGQLRDTVPMERAHTDAILATLYDTLSGVVQAMLATAVLQGILAGIGYWLAGMPFSLVLGVMSGFLSLIPYAVPLMWISCVIFLIVSGSLGSAIFLTLWGVLLIGSVDNIIRPLVIGERANLSAFLLFFAILGGLSVYGFLGLLLGPVLVAAVITLLQIYRLEYVTDRSAEGTDGTASS